MTLEKMWDELIALGVSEEAIQTVVDINGYSTGTMESILFARTGYRNFDQLEPDDDGEDDVVVELPGESPDAYWMNP
jgi:hypothetical protein